LRNAFYYSKIDPKPSLEQSAVLLLDCRNPSLIS